MLSVLADIILIKYLDFIYRYGIELTNGLWGNMDVKPKGTYIGELCCCVNDHFMYKKIMCKVFVLFCIVNQILFRLDWFKLKVRVRRPIKKH